MENLINMLVEFFRLKSNLGRFSSPPDVDTTKIRTVFDRSFDGGGLDCSSSDHSTSPSSSKVLYAFR